MEISLSMSRTKYSFAFITYLIQNVSNAEQEFNDNGKLCYFLHVII